MISFIVPCYNSQNTICRCIDSIISQGLKEYEIIIIDDGSIDDTKKIIKNNYSNHKNIKYYYKKNEGQGIARNFGISKSNGEYITFIDSDDYYFEKKLKLIEKYLNLEYDLTIFKLQKSDINVESTIDNEKEYLFYEKQIDILEGMLISRGEFFWIDASACNKIYKKSILEKYNIVFKSERNIFSEDSLFNMEYYAHVKKGIIIPINVYCYVINENSFTHTYNHNLISKVSNMIEEYKRVLNSAYLECKNELSNIICFKLFACVKHCMFCDYKYNNGKKINEMVNYYNQNSKEIVANNYYKNKEKIFLQLIKHNKVVLIKIYFLLKSI